MTEYITSGSSGLDSYIGGFPLQQFSIIKGDSDMYMDGWITLQEKNNEVVVVSEIRPTKIMEQQLTGDSEYYYGEITSLVDEIDFSELDAIIIEPDETLAIEELSKIAVENDVAIIIIDSSPVPEIEQSATVILETNSYIVNKTNRRDNIVIKKHTFKDNDVNPLKLELKPEPRISDTTEA